MLPGASIGEFRDALVAGFDDVDLAQLVQIHLNQNLAVIVSPGNLKHVTFQLVIWANRNGLVAQLARAAYAENPRNEKLRSIYEKFGMAPEVSVQEAGASVAGAPRRATAAALEGRVKPNLKHVDLGVWREKLAKIEGQVCRVEFGGNPKGTGFLVGPDLVLTNYHVLERPLKGQVAVAQVVCHFDYKVLSDGSRAEGTVVKLHEKDWRVDDSPYSKAEGDSRPDRELPGRDELDYALVRLARAVGSEPIDKGAARSAPARGWIELPEAEACLETDMPLMIAQHPDGGPLKLAFDTRSVLGINGNGTRVRYATNTEAGSSGSPCFDMDWTLVAVHHLGDPAWKEPKFNQGVPIARIRERLTGRVTLEAP
ncbi:hypothetical protein ACVMFA_003816 [Bradyrhizobium liaoningense]